MSVATCATLISEGLLLAGDTSLSERAVFWLNTWLRSQYRAWPWPFLTKKASGIALASGTTALTIGNGSGGITDAIQYIYDPVYLYDSGKTVRGIARFTDFLDGPLEWDESARPSTQTASMPQRFKGAPSTTVYGTWSLVPDPIPSTALLLSFNYLVQPADVATGTTGGSALPIYPSDRTIVQAIKTYALDYMKDERFGNEMALLARMAIDDRTRYGHVKGINDNWGLDKSTFHDTSKSDSWW